MLNLRKLIVLLLLSSITWNRCTRLNEVDLQSVQMTKIPELLWEQLH